MQSNVDTAAAASEVDTAGEWRRRAEAAEARVYLLERRLRYVRDAVLAVSEDDLPSR